MRVKQTDIQTGASEIKWGLCRVRPDKEIELQVEVRVTNWTMEEKWSLCFQKAEQGWQLWVEVRADGRTMEGMGLKNVVEKCGKAVCVCVIDGCECADTNWLLWWGKESSRSWIKTADLCRVWHMLILRLVFRWGMTGDNLQSFCLCRNR